MLHGSPQSCRGPASLTLSPSPFSLCCIAPVLAAKVLPGVEVTVGHEQEEGGKWPYAGTAEAIKAMGAKHCVKGVTISFPAAGDPCDEGSPSSVAGQAMSLARNCAERRGHREPWSKAARGLHLDLEDVLEMTTSPLGACLC